MSMGRTDGKKLEPSVCNCYLIPSKKKKNVMGCFRKDVWGALSEDQVGKLCSSVRVAQPTMAQIKHFNQFSKAVQQAAQGFKGKTLEEWRRAVHDAYAHPQTQVPEEKERRSERRRRERRERK